MVLEAKRVGRAALLVPALLWGCGPGPFARAAAAYAGASGEGAASLAVAPKTAFALCRSRAEAAYVQARLGLLPAPEGIVWNGWYATAPATERQTWAQYCEEIRATGEVFSLALAALREYAAALAALAEGERYDGADLERLARRGARLAASRGATAPSRAVQPIGVVLGRFAVFLFQNLAEEGLADAMRRADPLVEALAGGIVGYVEAVAGELRATERAQRQTLRALEARAGLLEVPADPVKLIVLRRHAAAVEAEIEGARAALAGYRGVAGSLRAAHGALVRAAASGDELEIKRARGEVVALVEQLRALGAALGSEVFPVKPKE